MYMKINIFFKQEEYKLLKRTNSDNNDLKNFKLIVETFRIKNSCRIIKPEFWI